MLEPTINARVDHEANFKRIIDKACSEASDAHVKPRAIVAYLRSQAQRLEDQTWKAAYATAIPKMYDGHGRPIDMAAKVEAARAERQRIADEKCVIPRDRRQHAASGYRAP